MSEDDIDTTLDANGAPRVDRDRRAPRFSWTPAYEATFFRSLCESVQLGLRENSSFKSEAWERAAAALQATHGAFPAKSHLINKSDNARKRFRLWRGLREDPEFLYNPVAKTVTATEEAWRQHIEVSMYARCAKLEADLNIRGNLCRGRCEDDHSTTRSIWRYCIRTLLDPVARQRES
jgi:hypothetical protein